MLAVNRDDEQGPAREHVRRGASEMHAVLGQRSFNVNVGFFDFHIIEFQQADRLAQKRSTQFNCAGRCFWINGAAMRHADDKICVTHYLAE